MYSFLLNWIGRVESSRISFTRNSDKVRHCSKQEEKFYVEPRSKREERNVDSIGARPLNEISRGSLKWRVKGERYIKFECG